MNQYIVIVEWKADEGISNNSLERLIGSNFMFVKLTSLAYIISSVRTPVEIRNFLSNHLTGLERLFIGELNASAAWKNMIYDADSIKRIFSNEQ